MVSKLSLSPKKPPRLHAARMYRTRPAKHALCELLEPLAVCPHPSGAASLKGPNRQYLCSSDLAVSQLFSNKNMTYVSSCWVPVSSVERLDRGLAAVAKRFKLIAYLVPM